MNLDFKTISQYSRIFTFIAISKVINLFHRSKKEIWIISERGNEARDNGYFLFKYIKEINFDKEVYYVISDSSCDYHKLTKYTDFLIKQNSFRHYLITERATTLISTHIFGAYPDPSRFLSLRKKLNLYPDKKVAFLQHGITKEIISFLFAKNLPISLFISGAKREKQLLDHYYGYKEGVVKLTGFPRFDSLVDQKTKNQILFMPTWRAYIKPDEFKDSDYFKNISSVLKSSEIHKILEENDLNLIFYPHFEFQKYIEDFKVPDLPPNIIIAGFEYDVQTLLKESKLLITDYSSVYFDFAYMRKPIISFAFDYDEYYGNHYSRGEYDGELFGPVVKDLDDLVLSIKSMVPDFKLSESYRLNVDTFFGFNDSNNCKRVVDAINQLSIH